MSLLVHSKTNVAEIWVIDAGKFFPIGKFTWFFEAIFIVLEYQGLSFPIWILIKQLKFS